MDLTELFVRLATQVPSLAVLVIVVVVFIRYLIKRDEVLQSIGDDCHQVQRESIEAIRENSKTLGEVSNALRHLSNGQRKF